MSEPTRMLAVSEAGSMNEIEMALAEPTHAKVTATRINGSNTRTFICAPSTVRASLYRTRRVCKQAFPVPTVILNGGAQLQAFVVDGAYNNLQTNAERFIKNVQLRMGGMGGVAVDHGPLSALTFASLASTSAI